MIFFLVEKILYSALLVVSATAIMFHVCRSATTISISTEIYLECKRTTRKLGKKDLRNLERNIFDTAKAFYQIPNQSSDVELFTLARNILQLQISSPQAWNRTKQRIKRSIPTGLKKQMIQNPEVARELQPNSLNFLNAIHAPAKFENFNFIKGTALYHHGDIVNAIASYETFLENTGVSSTPVLANWASLRISQRSTLDTVISRLQDRLSQPMENSFLTDLLYLRLGEAYVARRNFSQAVDAYQNAVGSSNSFIARKANLRLGDLKSRGLNIGYAGWLIRFATFNLGRSASSGEEVGSALNLRLMETLKLLVSASGIALGFSLLIVVLLVEFPESFSLKLSISAIYIISGIPVFLLSYLCLKWFPKWLYPDENGNFSPLFYGLVGSCLAFGSASVNLFIQRLQQETLLLLNRDFFLAVRVRQANIFRHLLKNLVIPVTSTYCAQFPILLSGAIIVEIIFTYPGIGHWLLLAVEKKDFPVVLPVCSVLVILVCGVNILKDSIQLLVDPKLRS